MLTLVVDKVTKPRTQTATSVPGLLSLMQSEWDALMLEIHTLKEHLQATRQELSLALYQHEAACRVVCRLLKERDEARGLVAELKGMRPSAPLREPKDDPALKESREPGIDQTLAASFNALSDSLCEARKSRKVPEDLVPAKDIAGYKESHSVSLHPSGESRKGGVSCLDLRKREEGLALSGGKDGLAHLYDLAAHKVLATFNYKKKVTMASFLPGSRLALAICSADATAE